MSVTKSIYITTYTGIRFDLMNPNVHDVSIRDIAHALSQINRWTGHTCYPYSVAQHSVLCADLVSSEFKLWALLHDAHEAYTGDVATPIKRLLPQYTTWEIKIARIVRLAMGLTDKCPPEVKAADGQMLALEYQALMLKKRNDFIREWSPDLAEWAFLDVLKKCGVDVTV